MINAAAGSFASCDIMKLSKKLLALFRENGKRWLHLMAFVVTCLRSVARLHWG